MASVGTAESAKQPERRWSCLLLVCSMLLWSSCRHRGEARHYLGPEIAADYVAHATAIDYPDTGFPVSPKLEFAIEPRRLRHDYKDDIWDLTLQEAIQTSLANSTVIRSAGQFLNPGNPLLNNPDFAPSIYDAALQETGVLFGQRGVEAALSDFDTQYTTQMLWGRNESVQNNLISNGLPAGSTLIEETAAYNSALRKRLATGGQVELSQTWNYTARNITPNQFGNVLFPSVYEGNLQFQFRQPLLAGGGAEYTRIAGPVSSNIQGVTGVQQGVIIARINNDIELADFEKSVHQLVHDVESLYWQLQAAYRIYDSIVETRNGIMDAWRIVDAQRIAETGEGATQEADVRDSLLNLQGRADMARDGIYSTEAQLRLLMGLPVNDGRVIRPIDEPITAEIIPEWTVSLSDALIRRPEIRRQKWNIKSAELQLRAAENLLMPRFDFVSSYQLNGFGDHLAGGDGQFSSAIKEELSGDHEGWNLGFEFSVPVGRRFSKAQVHSHEFRLVKAQEMLGEIEMEISHEVASVVRSVDSSYFAMQGNYNRLLAAKQRLTSIRSQYNAEPERISIDAVTRALESVSQAQLTLINSVQQYNVALADLNFRTGSTLEQSNIRLSENAWNGDAYYDALERYEERSHAKHRRWQRFTHTAPDLTVDDSGY